MSTSGLRSRRRIAFVVPVLWSLLGGQVAVAANPPNGRDSTVPQLRPSVGTARVGDAARRGHVEIGKLPSATGMNSAIAAPRTSGPAAPGIQSGPPVDYATTNATVKPSIGKLPVASGDANIPNPAVAVGPDHVARSDDGSLTIMNRGGFGATTVSFFDFFLLSSGMESLQGQVFYDLPHGRWIAIEASRDCVANGGAQYGHGYLDIAISDSANPRLGWTIYYYTYDDALVWDPGYGTSADKIALTSRFHSMGPGCISAGSDSWDATAISWAGLIAGSFGAYYHVFEENVEDRPANLTPAIRQDAASNTLLIIYELYDFGSSSQQQWLYRIDGLPGSATGSLAALPVPAFGNTTTIFQGSSSFYPGVAPISVVAQAQRLVIALAEGCTPSGDTVMRNCVRIIDLDVSTPQPTRRQDFYMAAATKDTYSPGVAFSTNGDLVITYQRSTPSVGPSASVVHQAPADALNSISTPRILVSATDFYANLTGAEMIGLQPDPLVPDSVWVINQAGGSTEPYSYLLQVGQARTAVGDTYVPITPLRILDTRTGTGLSGGFVANIPRTFNVAGAGTIPANAVAITGNVTVAGQSAAGYLSVGPTATANPTSSTINFPVGDNRANNLTLPLNAAGDLAAVYKAGAGKTTHVIVDVTGYFLADSTGVKYHTITPARVLDSRAAYHIGLSGKFVANTPRTFQVSGHAGVPTGAVAITGNLTVVGQTRAGYVSLTPAPDANPLTSTINFPLGDTRANGVTVPLSAAGKLSAVFKASGGTTDLILDVSGYYIAGASGLRFYPLNPGRIMDTRFNTLTQLFGPFTSSIPRTLNTGGHFGVPTDGAAVTGNLTVVGQTKAGYVSITKLPDSTPSVSTLNFPLGDVRANGVTVPLNAANDMALVYKASSGSKTHLILDLTGYFR
jgi:hypothetical protein